MLSKIFGTISLLIAGESLAKNTSGVHAELDIAVIQQAKEVYVADILNFLNNIQIPDIGDGDNYLHENSISFTEEGQNVVFDTDLDNNSLTLNINDLSAKWVTKSFHVKEIGLTAKGDLDVELNTISVGLGLAFNIQKLPNGNVVPVFNAVDVNIDIDKDDLKINIHGNVWSDFANTFTVFFKGTIIDLINDNIATVLTSTIPDSLNNLVYNQKG